MINKQATLACTSQLERCADERLHAADRAAAAMQKLVSTGATINKRRLYTNDCPINGASTGRLLRSVPGGFLKGREMRSGMRHMSAVRNSPATVGYQIGW